MQSFIPKNVEPSRLGEDEDAFKIPQKLVIPKYYLKEREENNICQVKIFQKATE